MKPAVIVGVEGGCADYSSFGDVDVIVIDWDFLKEDADVAYIQERIAVVTKLKANLSADQVIGHAVLSGILVSLAEHLRKAEQIRQVANGE